MESAIRNKLIDLLPVINSFKFVAALVLEFRKIKRVEKTKYDILYLNSKQKQLLMKVTLTMFLNQSVLQLYQSYKNLWEKVQAGLLIQS